MFRFFLAIALFLGAPAAAYAELTPAGADLWRRDGDRIIFTTARFSFPTQVGPAALDSANEISQPGEGLDSVLLYHSPDRQITISVYVYYPGLPDAGITAYATDNALHYLSGSELRQLSVRTVGAGGRDNVAIRADYSGYLESRLASSAAFLRAGHWIVKLRVSGPEQRRAEVERTMTDLLAGIRFEGTITPWRAQPLNVADCRDRPTQTAALISTNGPDAAGEAFFGVLAAGGVEANESADAPAIGPQWCLSVRAHIGNSTLPILRAEPTPGNHDSAVLIAVVSDAGTLVEVVRSAIRNKYELFHHRIGQTLLLGAYSTVPTDQQIVDILSGADRAGGQARARIRHKANGGTDVTLLVAPSTAPTAPAH